MPESMHKSIWRAASAAVVVPTLLRGSLPPKVMVPMVMTETLRPERPSVRYSIWDFLVGYWPARGAVGVFETGGGVNARIYRTIGRRTQEPADYERRPLGLSAQPAISHDST